MNKPKTNSRKNIVGCKQPEILSPEEHEAILEWSSIDWKEVERTVYKLQKRIYLASQNGDVKKVRKLQRTLIQSYSNRLLAVRRVTQDNQGKNTAGVDGIKSLRPKARFELVNSLKVGGKSKPTRRVWIPKPGKDEKRPLGIPTMYDRALQAVVKNALEPEWEALFEPNSYGFRPGRSCQDAIKMIWTCLRYKSKYVLDADIAKCFDRINHEALLKKVNQKGRIRRQIKAWLGSGVVDNNLFQKTEEGTPQGGVISPLLANVALHGMENVIRERFPTDKSGYVYPAISRIYGYGGGKLTPPVFVRYADDFVVICEDKSVVEECRRLIIEFLEEIGLELKPEKTRLAHTLVSMESEDGKAGFDFLGFNIVQRPISKYKSTVFYGKILGFQTYITPSSKKIKEHQLKLKKVIFGKCLKVPQIRLIPDLNPIIRGWCNYYRVSDAKTIGIMAKQDHEMFLKLSAWEKRRAGNVEHGRFFRRRNNRKWNFCTEEGIELVNYVDTSCSVEKYVKVAHKRSPYDGDWVYWGMRMGQHPETSARMATLLKKQKGKCPVCKLYFKLTDVIEVDHIKAKALGGEDKYNNLQLLHGHCHDIKTANDIKRLKESRVKHEISSQ